MLIKDNAICIRSIDYSETSQIVTFFTRDIGKISAIAKGARRHKSSFDGPIEVLSSGHIVFTSSDEPKLVTLTEFQQDPSPPLTDLYSLNCSYYACELINALTDEYDPHQLLFDSLLKFVRKARQSKEKTHILSVLVLFQLKLLQQIGLLPILTMCGNCKSTARQNWQAAFFSSSANTILCGDCEAHYPDKIRFSKSALEALTNLKKLDQYPIKTLLELEKLLTFHFTEMLHRPPKMAKHILKP
ncbi:MAG: DNA repair protein RecO [Phycisphaerae bacterium]|nr:DNA repair protein RecO [Phycisphaerae bacterium]